jgi:hypothetical protein
MPVLTNPRHEQFAQGLLQGLSATRAYVLAGFSEKGASQSAARLLRNAEICSRVMELRAEVSAATIQLEITDRNARVKALQDTLDRCRRLIEARAADMPDVPGGSTGLLVRDYKGKDANQPVYKADTPLLAEMRATMKQAAEELGQWVEKSEENVTVNIVERLQAGRRRALARGANG